MTRIHPQTLDFLSNLAQNNTREWFEQHKEIYTACHQNMIDFAQELISLTNQFDAIENQSGKKTLYRIYRDTRFSKDKTPYKNYWGGYLSRLGKERRGGLHFDICPGGKSFIGCGFWAPNKEDLLLIRQQIAADSTPLHHVLKSKEFKSYFKELKGNELKTAPKGFDKEQQDIELIRKKQYLVFRSFTDQEVLSDQFAQQMAEGFRQSMPFLNVMTQYLTTDLNGRPL